MLLNKKIAIIADTNIYVPSKKNPYDLTKLPLEKYFKQIKTIEISNLEDKVDLLLPEVVLLELLYHNKEKLEETIGDLKRISKYLDNLNVSITGFEDLDLEEYLKKLKNDYEDLKIVPLPSDKEELFDTILYRCLNRLPPFENNIDKGFKDTLIYLSMLNFAKNNLYSEYIFFSNDNIFKNKKKMLENEFNQCLKENGILKKSRFEIKTQENINNYINKKFELFKELRDYISNEFYGTIKNHYKTAENFVINDESYKIKSFDVVEDETLINLIDENKFEVEITLSCKYYSNNLLEKSLEKEIKTQYLNEKYIFTKEENDWKYVLDEKFYIVLD